MTDKHLTKFKIGQMRQDKIILGVESIAVFILAIFISIFLPQLLFQFYYANLQLTAEPALITYIPTISFAVAVGFFVYAMGASIMKKLKITQLEKELEMMMTDEACCGGGCGCDHGSWSNEDANMAMASVMNEPKPKAKKTTTRKK